MLGDPPHHGQRWNMGSGTTTFLFGVSAPQVPDDTQVRERAMAPIKNIFVGIEQHVSWRWVINVLLLVLDTWVEVFRQSFWMSRWGGKSPKRTTLWSNSSGIRYFATTKKYARMKARSAKQKLADIYFDRHGQKRYKGNAKLKASQPYT